MDASSSSMAVIQASKHEFIIVDDNDFEKVKKFRWYVNRMGYAANDATPRKLMHRLIMNFPKGGIDHKNGNKLDNRKSNLRPCNQSENMANAPKRKTNLSGYKGVSWDKKYSKWEAYLTKDCKHIFLGYFDDRKEAALAYNQRAIKEFGGFCKLNEL